VYKLCHDGYWAWLQERKETGLEEFRQLVEKEDAKNHWFEAYRNATAVWEKEVAEWGEYHSGYGVSPTHALQTKSTRHKMAM
jgi:hypothetical protein